MKVYVGSSDSAKVYVGSSDPDNDYVGSHDPANVYVGATDPVTDYVGSSDSDIVVKEGPSDVNVDNDLDQGRDGKETGLQQNAGEVSVELSKESAGTCEMDRDNPTMSLSEI